jgi:Protein of unknown function (DUF2844)
MVLFADGGFYYCRSMGSMADTAVMLHNIDMTARLVLVAISFLWMGEARAGLGGDLTSVLDDAADMHGAVQTSPLQQFEIDEIVTDNGMRVREFLNRKGIVFAVTWAGPAAPDLRRLLGAQFAVYASALTTRTRLGLQRSVRVATPDLVVESEGHLRNFTGRAYLPAMLPIGVATTDIR